MTATEEVQPSLRTVGGVLRLLFPNGTEKTGEHASASVSVAKCPVFSASIFGAAAYLLERGGAYHRIAPNSRNPRARAARKLALHQWDESNLFISDEEVELCRDLGERWYRSALQFEKPGGPGVAPEAIRELTNVFAEVQKLWDELYGHRAANIVERPRSERPIDWWLPALKLLIIADEASRDLGFTFAEGSPPSEQFVRQHYVKDDYRPLNGSGSHVLHKEEMVSLAVLMDPNVARVVPKSRTPSVGCTMRALSHNLALVPPDGEVDTYWYRELAPISEDREPCNVLLVPLPYHISASAFRALEKTDPATGPGWGWFTMDQPWLFDEDGTPCPKLIAEFICELIAVGVRDVGRIHGVVLPEFALDWPTYMALVEALQAMWKPRKGKSGRRKGKSAPPVDFLISGLSSVNKARAKDRKTKLAFGNFVATTKFSLDDDDNCVAATYHRSKHHRWQLTKPQIDRYALSASLDPNYVWWETCELPKRAIGLSLFRRGAVFTVIICEDLARMDPCHGPLRAVGPNLVFVLLMDGPQLPHRWSARYAAALAEDPGCSVLTFTSLALMERSNRTMRESASLSVAFWKDDTGNERKIECPPGAQAVLLTLSGEAALEATMDGRVNSDTQAWRLLGYQPLSAPSRVRNDPKYARLLYEP